MLWGRLLAVLAVAATTAAPALIATPAAASPRIAWGSCADPAFAAAGAECGSLAVPLAYDDPSGPRVEIALSRVRHRVPDAQYQGVLITVAGGPGGSGLQTFTASGPRVPDHAAEAYDWVSFDARGVGASRPALSCDPDYMDYRRPDYVPTTEKLEQTWLTRVRRYAQDCGAKNDPALLANIKTADTARDIDAIRAALGVSRVTLYGISYGTYVLQVYGTLFPTRVRRMVLDSTVDPRYVFYQVNLNQDVAMNRNLGAWMEWTARYDQVYHLGTTAAAVRKVYDAQFSRLRATPAGGLVGPDELTDIFVIAEYGQSGWPTVADVFARLVRGDWQPAKELFDAVGGRGNDNGYAVYLATQCTDVQWPTDWNRWHADNWRTYPQAPDFTWMNAWYNAPCIAWPARAGTPVTIDGKGVPSVLMVGEEYDGATPFPGSIEVRKRFPGASLILEPGGTSHAASLSGNPCVDPAIARYLLTGERPPRKPGDGPDALCAPLPEPVPPSA
ncbi:peptidase [Actinoplanes sp. NBRC 14428]|nr:peptidase [Actinoplanes sp. NBRC 14428]